jgi:DNA-binding NtrC family response regulator
MTPGSRQRLLVIEDDPGVSEVVQLLLMREGYDVERASCVADGLRHLSAHYMDLVITDLKLPDGTGLDAIRTIRETDEGIPIIMMTSYSSMESAIAALRVGAVDYIVKPFDNEEFLHAVARALDERRLRRENAALKRSLESAYAPRPLIGESPGMKKVLELIRKAGPSDANALICGESGTGKELAALDLHHRGPRAGGPFVPFNCGGFPSALLEQELFGSVTQEHARSAGRIREAHGGTLFLDEVSELAAPLQAKLVRVLEDKAVRPVGGKRSFEADVRYLAASNRDLAAAVESGQFRKDLYYRLNVISLHLPPLRHRGADVLRIAGHFLEQYARKLGKPVRGFDAEFCAFMSNYPWPGNVRELENFVQRAVILAEGELLTGRDLAELAPALPMVRASAPPATGARPLAIEEYIREVVERFQDTHSESELAKMLGIGRKALWMRRRQWGLRRSHKADR